MFNDPGEWANEIIPASQALTKFSDAQEVEYRTLRDAINLAIRERFDGRQAYVDVPKYPSPRVKTRAEEACRKAGWQIAFHDDQRDGPSANLTLTATDGR